MKNLLANKPVQVIENLTGIALGNGFSLPEGMNRKDWAEQEFSPNLDQDEYISNFMISLLEVEKIRDYFITQLKKTLNPLQYGIERPWRQTQREALQAIIKAFEHWFTRPLVEIPTGAGKSMIWGAIIRAFYDTLRVFGVEEKFEITLFTSRINIADQMIGLPALLSEDDDDEPLIYGDVKMWLPMFSDDDIRILAGRSGSSKEFEKNAKVTLACYQGLTTKTVDILYKKKAGLVVCDESHRVTDRIRIILENKMHTAFFVGGSATTKGQRWNNPFIFFEAIKPEEENGEIVPYHERLAYHASILECINRRELKPVRYINARTYIDLTSVKSQTRELPVQQTAKVVAKNIPIMKAILEELFVKDNEVLTAVGAKSVIDRKWLVFVDRIKIAEELSFFCNNELKQLIDEKHGDGVNFIADYVSGEIGMTEFNRRMDRYHNNETTIMFTSEKLGEGADVPEINGILSFRPYSVSALWKSVQEIGRGTRFIPGEDLLVVDGVFKSERHEIGSLLSIFGVNIYLNGGLVAGYTGQREVEMKIFTLLKQGLTWKKVWESLTDEEKELAGFIRGYLGQGVYGPEQINLKELIPVKSIEFIENKSVKSHELMKEKGNLIEMAKEQLKLNGINDYWDLVYKFGTFKFTRLNFGVFSSPIYFCRYLGVRIGQKNYKKFIVTYDTLNEVAKKINWMPSEEERINKYKEEFRKHGITDYWSLVSFSLFQLGKVEFGDFKKIKNFAGAILNTRSFDLNTVVLYEKIASILGWELSEEQKKEHYLLELAKHNIRSYGDLKKYDMLKLKALKYGVIGHGQKFFSIILKEPATNLTRSKLELAAEYLGWSKIDYLKELLAKRGIVDHSSLIGFGKRKLGMTKFGEIGSGVMLLGRILDIPHNTSIRIDNIDLDQVSSKLGWLTSDEGKKELAKKILADYGIFNYWELKKIRPVKFRSMEFGSLGKASKFLRFSLNKIFKRITFSVMDELAIWLGWMPSDEDKNIVYTEELKKNGIMSYKDLVNIPNADFKAMSFGQFGKGAGFIAQVLAIEKGKVDKEFLYRVAKKLKLEGVGDDVLYSLNNVLYTRKKKI